jgi:alkanesulfonate monooxygenase SsuD/methylene tetrahydromethanopterin reductase-like flavin-dependent oxidoreductase (luciferase family)
MRFDFIPYFNAGEVIPWTQTIEMMRAQTAVAEEAGFTTVWLTEHHFAHNGYLNAAPNPILICADLAARFSRIRVGQAPVVLPDWHPLRVAEDIAMLDNITGGRVDFGVGRGINERTCLQFDVRADKRDDKKSYAMFRECLEVILKAWTQDPFTHKGEYFTFPQPGWYETNRFFEPHDPRYHAPDGEYIAMSIHPKTYQKPHPPVWFMSNAPFTFDYAGSQGFNLIAMSAPHGNIKACWNAYKDAVTKATGTEAVLGEGVGMCTFMYVAPTMEEAERDIRPAINHYYNYISGTRPSGEWARKGFLNKDEELTAEDRDSDWFDFLQSRGIIWVGSPDYITERIEICQEAFNLQHLMMLQQYPGLGLEKVLASLSLFAEKVMPRFA